MTTDLTYVLKSIEVAKERNVPYATFDELTPQQVAALKELGYSVRKPVDCSGGYVDTYYEIRWPKVERPKFQVEFLVKAVGRRIYTVEADDEEAAWEACRNFEAKEFIDKLEVTDIDWNNSFVNRL